MESYNEPERLEDAIVQDEEEPGNPITDDNYSEKSTNIHLYDGDDIGKTIIDDWVHKKVWVRVESERSKYNGCVAQVKFRQGRGRQNQMKVHVYVDDGNGGYYVQEAGISIASCQLATEEDTKPIMEWLGITGGLTSRMSYDPTLDRQPVIDEWVHMKAWVKIESEKSKYRNCIGQIRFRQGRGRQNQMKAQVYVEDGNGGYNLHDVGVSVCNCRLATEEETKPIVNWLLEFCPKQAELAGLIEKVRTVKPPPQKRAKRVIGDTEAEFDRLVNRKTKDVMCEEDMDKLRLMADWISNKTWVKIVSEKHKFFGCFAKIKNDKSGSKFQLLADIYVGDKDEGFTRNETSVALSSCELANDEECAPVKKWVEDHNEAEEAEKMALIQEWVANRTWVQVTSERSKLNGYIGQIRFHHGSDRKFCMRGHFYVDDGNGGYHLNQSTVSVYSCQPATEEQTKPILQWLEFPPHLRKYSQNYTVLSQVHDNYDAGPLKRKRDDGEEEEDDETQHQYIVAQIKDDDDDDDEEDE